MWPTQTGDQSLAGAAGGGKSEECLLQRWEGAGPVVSHLISHDLLTTTLHATVFITSSYNNYNTISDIDLFLSLDLF